MNIIATTTQRGTWPEQMPNHIRQDLERHGGEGLPWAPYEVIGAKDEFAQGWRLLWADQTFVVYREWVDLRPNPGRWQTTTKWEADGTVMTGRFVNEVNPSVERIFAEARRWFYLGLYPAEPEDAKLVMAPVTGPEGLLELLAVHGGKTSLVSFVRDRAREFAKKWQRDRERIAELEAQVAKNRKAAGAHIAQLEAKVAELEDQQAKGYRSALNGGTLVTTWAKKCPEAAAEHERRREISQGCTRRGIYFLGGEQVSKAEWDAAQPGSTYPPTTREGSWGTADPFTPAEAEEHEQAVTRG